MLACSTKPGAIPVYGYKVVHVYPHDISAYTEGLFYKDGFLYESTGEAGESTVRKVELQTGEGGAALQRAAAVFRRGHRGLEGQADAADLEEARSASSTTSTASSCSAPLPTLAKAGH
jgi:glutamine cyclotransferase